MYCTRCGTNLRDEAHFCSQCGTQIAPIAPVETMRRLMLDKRDKKIGGVCAGFARYFGMDLVLMRIIWLAVSLGTGVGFLVYLGAWIVLPKDDGTQSGEIVAVPTHQRM